MEFKKIVNDVLGVLLSDEQLNKLTLYYELLVSYNEHTNLTAITEKQDVYIKHFLDSMMLAKVVDNQEFNLCDMGAGAGFPSLPLKIIYPHISVTIVDSLGKRIKFLETLVSELELTNVELVHERAEVYALNNKKRFDFVTARALGHLRYILEMGVPMLKESGKFIALKSTNLENELNEAAKAILKLKVTLINQHEYELPLVKGLRYLLVFQKESHVSGYPRSYSVMKNKPL